MSCLGGRGRRSTDPEEQGTVDRGAGRGASTSGMSDPSGMLSAMEEAMNDEFPEVRVEIEPKHKSLVVHIEGPSKRNSLVICSSDIERG